MGRGGSLYKLYRVHLLACLPDTNKEHFRVSLVKGVLLFLPNQAAQFISCGIVCFCFLGIYFYHSYLSHDFKILFKSKGRGTFSWLALSVNVQQTLFYNWKLYVQYVIFWIGMAEFWIWFIGFISLDGQHWNHSSDVHILDPLFCRWEK